MQFIKNNLKFIILFFVILIIITVPISHNFLHKNYYNKFGERTIFGLIDRGFHYLNDKSHYYVHLNNKNIFINFIDYIYHYSYQNNYLEKNNNSETDSRYFENEGLNFSKILEIQLLDSSVNSSIELSKYIAEIKDKANLQKVDATKRNNLIYDYPFNFSYSSPVTYNKKSYSLENKINNLNYDINYLLDRSKLKKGFDDIHSSDKKFIMSQINYLSSLSSYNNIEIIFDKLVNEENINYRVIYFKWDSGLFGYSLIGSIYLPPTKSLKALVLHPLGCGSYIGRNDNIDRQHSRMASLAEHGIGVISLTGICSNPPFNREANVGFARQHDALFYISNSQIQPHELELFSYYSILKLLQKKYNFNYDRLALMGYSNGANISNNLARFLNPDYLIHVSSSINTSIIHTAKLISNEDLKVKYIFSKYDTLSNVDLVEKSILNIKNLFNKVGKNFNIEVSYNNDSTHNFGDDKSEIAIKFLTDNLGINCSECYKYRSSLVSFKLKDTIKSEVIKNSFYDIYTKYIISNNAIQRKLSFDSSIESLKKIIIEKYNIKNKNGNNKKIFLINKKKFYIDNLSYEYNSWSANFLSNLNSNIYRYFNNDSSLKVLVIADDLYDLKVKNDIKNYLVSGYEVIAIEPYGFGMSADTQKPIGIHATNLANNNNSLLNLNHNFLDLIFKNFRDISEIKSYGVESSILSSTYSFVNNFNGQVYQENSFYDFEYFFNHPVKPIVPPMLKARNIYPYLNFYRIREIKKGGRIIVNSNATMSNYIPSQ